MSIHNKNTTISHIKQAIKYIPTVWPLQQFIATNPFWDLVEQPLETISAQLNQLKNIRTTLSLSEYWNYYQTGQISDLAIHQAISESKKPDCDNKESVKDDVATRMYRQILYGFITENENYEELVTQAEIITQSQSETRSVLISNQIQKYGYDNAIQSIKESCLNWLSIFFNPTEIHENFFPRQTVSSKAAGTHCFFDFWCNIIKQKDKNWHVIMSSYNGDPVQFINFLLNKLRIPEQSIQQYIFDICWELKGWNGYIKWQQQYPDNPYVNKTATTIEIIAMWLAYEVHWLKTHAHELNQFTPNFEINYHDPVSDIVSSAWFDYIQQINHQLSKPTREYIDTLTNNNCITYHQLCWLWQRAYEISYHEPLFRALSVKKQSLSRNSELSKTQNHHHHTPPKSKAQWVFCIDVRSEGLRRILEKNSQHLTYGCAGFFGFTYKLQNKTQQQLTFQCPALLEPTLSVEIQYVSQSFYQLLNQNIMQSIDENKKLMLSPFVLYEMLGFWFTVTLVLKNYATDLFHRMKRLCKQPNQTIKINHSQTLPDLTIDQPDLSAMIISAKNLLESISLVKDFSPFVILCGHGATTENNPYQSALNCGACGGNSGMSNAVIACQILNKPEVRDALVEQGISIPKQTVFIAACHDTTTDDIQWYENYSNLTEQQIAVLAEIKQDATQAGEQLQYERLASLPGTKNAKSRSRHWAELIPEWGLADNAAMIIAPRNLTRGFNLERRVFLHSYDPACDSDGSILEAIFSGPLVVAHWINSQYYFSAIEPQQFGAGNKAIHNLLPAVGVVEGNSSDLQFGLPLQSLFFRGRCMHSPQRLCVFVDAEQNRINNILNKHPLLRALVEGQWLFIKSLQIANRRSNAKR